jgi:hypothetical protein
MRFSQTMRKRSVLRKRPAKKPRRPVSQAQPNNHQKRGRVTQRKKVRPVNQPSETLPQLPFASPEEEQAAWDAWNRAYYGKEQAESPLFWALEKVHGPYWETYEYFAKHKIRAWVKDSNYVQVLYEDWKQRQKEDELPATFELLPASLLFEWMAIGVRQRDWRLFEDITRLLRDKIGQCAAADQAGRWARSAYMELKQPGKEPTKVEVRECAVRKWKIHNILMRGPRPWTGDMPTSAEILLEKIPKQNWTRVFKRTGLSHLPSGKGGQPSHKKNTPSLYCLQSTADKCI